MTLFVIGLGALSLPVAFPLAVMALNRSARARIAAEADTTPRKELTSL
jgi:hypothetical protein